MSDSASSPEPTSNHQTPDYGSSVGSAYPPSAVAVAVAAAAAAAAVSNSGTSGSSSGSGGLALANASGVSAMHQATSLTSNYHSSVMSSMYSDRAYENQMGGHCQTNSYSAYQPPPSPYRPHPVSPPAHHQSPYGGTPGAGQMHLPSLSYSSGHQLSPYSTSQGHYGPSPLSNQDVYSGRSPPIYGGSPNAHLLQQSMKPPSTGSSSPWIHPTHDNNNGDLLYQGQSSASRSLPIPSHLSSSTPSSPMPPPPMRSPPVSMSTPIGHYHRQMPPNNSSPSHSPHTWTQSGQIPSPSGGMLHSPRTTPSPLPNHGRSPGHTPFSPPPASATPSPHHHHQSPMIPPSPMTPHHQQQHQQQSCKTPPNSSSSSPPPNQSVSSIGSPSQPSGMVGGPSDPLQSLQKMVMLDSEMVSAEATAAVARGQYEMNQSHPHPHPPPPPTHQPHHQQHHPGTNTTRPSSYFSSVENLAGNDPGSPYPTYYNLDQNRLCTPPRAGVSTPTSSTFTSAQDSASNSSVSVESYPVVVDSSHHLNGDMGVSQHQRIDCNPRPSGMLDTSHGSDSMIDCGMSNGNSNEMITSYDIPGGYTGKKKYPKGGRGRRRSPSEFGVNQGDKDPMIYGPMGARKPYPGNDGTNGQMDYYPDLGIPRKRGRGSRFAGTPRWGGRMLVGDGENELGGASASAEEVSGVCSLDEGGMYLSLALKRGQRKKRSVASPGGIPPPMGDNMMEDPRYNDPSLAMGRPPRARGLRAPRGSGRRSRRRAGGAFSHFVNERPPFDGGFLDSSGNATDGLRESSYLGGTVLDPSVISPREPSIIGGGEDENIHEGGGGGPFLKTGILEAPRTLPVPPPGSSQDLQFSPQVPGNAPPSHIQENIGTGSRGPDDYYSQHSYQGEINPGMTMSSGYPGQPQVERKRGRPRGSKNKPKLPGEENSPKKVPAQQQPGQVVMPIKSPTNPTLIKKVEEVPPPVVETENPFLKNKVNKPRTFLGPVIRMTGSREKPLSVEVVNFAVNDEVKEANKLAKQKRPPQAPMSSMGPSVLARKKLGVLGHSSTLSPLYDAFTRDRSWVCSLCHKGSHYRGMGDLFGPYFSSEDQQRMAESAASATPTGPYSSGVPTPTSIPENEESNKVWDSSTPAGPQQAQNSPLNRQVRGKRKRSDASEECLKSTLLKRAKQGKKSSSILGGITANASTASSMDGIHSAEADCSSISMATSGPLPNNNTELSHSGTEYWVHEDCAIWSQGVYLVRQRVRGLDEAVKEAAEMICCKCKLNGATLGCFSKGCTEQYHFICAKDRGCEMDELNFSMLCPKHKQYKMKVEIKQEDCGPSSCNTTLNTTTTMDNAC